MATGCRLLVSGKESASGSPSALLGAVSLSNGEHRPHPLFPIPYSLAIRLLVFVSVAVSSFGAETGARTSGQALSQAREIEANLQRAIERSRAAFVFIGGGSGICISPDGYVFTNYHVVQRHAIWNIRVFGSARFHVADVVGFDPLGDVALLKIRDARSLPCALLADLTSARVGQMVLALGDPYKLGDLEGPPSASWGTLCALHRYQNDPRAPATTFFADALQTDAAVNPGSSGGPLFDFDGRLLGITGLIMSRFGGKANSGIAYAVPADQLTRFLPLLKKANGTAVHHGTLPNGLNLKWDQTEDAGSAGTFVASVEKSSTAEHAGFRAGDRIVKADGEIVTGPYRLVGIVQSQPEEVSMTFDVVRDEQRISLACLLPRYQRETK